MSIVPPNRTLAVALASVVLLVTGVACLSEAEQESFTVDLESQEQLLTRVDEDGRTVYGWNRLTGPTEFDGQSATIEMLGNVAYEDGDGPFFGFVTLTLEDGSVLSLRMTGETDAEDDTANANFLGSVSIIGGTGAYLGARGSGRIEGERSAELGTAVRMDFDLKIKTDD